MSSDGHQSLAKQHQQKNEGSCSGGSEEKGKRKAGAFYLCTFLLTLLIIVVVVIGGAYLFRAIELPNERELISYQKYVAEYVVMRVWKVLVEIGSLVSQPQNKAVSLLDIKNSLTRHTQLLSEAIHVYNFQGEIPKDVDSMLSWTVSNALIYSTSVMTTIGYGNVVPLTRTGKLLTVPFSLCCTPIMLFFVMMLGLLVAQPLSTALYHSATCCFKKKIENQNQGVIPLSIRRGGRRLCFNLAAALLFLLVLLVGTVFFSCTQGWKWQDSLYFSYVSFSTIGFGDYVPTFASAAGQSQICKLSFTVLLLVFGMAIFSTVFGIITNDLSSTSVASSVHANKPQQAQAHPVPVAIPEKH